MEFYYRMYFSEDLADKRARIIRKLQQGQFRPGLYLFTLAQGSQNHLEFYSSLLLKQKVIDYKKLFIVGIASGYDEALYLTEEIADEVYQCTGDADIRSYILEEQKAYKEGKRQV